MDEEIKNDEDQEESKEESTEESKDSEKALDNMTAKELREIAIDIPGVTGVHALKKESLLAIIKQGRGIKHEAPGKGIRNKTDKSAPSIKVLKDKIVELRKEKESARKTGDRHRIDILRRRINRVKKQTRRIAQT
ncbi:MAG: transcription termination factor Rho [Thermodesulfobacteriota bacterium]|nr:transcription termination factor Rho [Thermodesulfobacteriota bacterium]